MSESNKPAVKHHYNTREYLRPWLEGKTVPAFIRDGDELKKVRPSLEQTGFENYLYKLHSFPEWQQDFAEKKFFQEIVDEPGHRALAVLREGDLSKLTDQQRADWARYLLSVRFRNPDYIKKARSDGEAALIASTSADPEEWNEANVDGLYESPMHALDTLFPGQRYDLGLKALMSFLQDEKAILDVMRMTFAVFDLRGSTHPLLTSDRPLWVTHGLGNPQTTWSIPISPTQLFVASRNPQRHLEIAGQTKTSLAAKSNKTVVNSADRTVYGNATIEFVRKHLKRRA